MNYSQIKGFNYQPSWGCSGVELWRKFDPDLMRVELGRGKKFFPKMNAIRLWLSYDAFIYSGQTGRARFCSNFEAALTIAHTCGLRVMPVLFNRWHDAVLDYGGIYVDHFVPKLGWVGQKFAENNAAYLEAVVKPHADDERIFAWDLCNEPFSYSRPASEIPEIEAAEYDWLKSVHDACKGHGAVAPITIGNHMGVPPERVDAITDLVSIHPYWFPDSDKAAFEKHLDDAVESAQKSNKPILATETCWGSHNDAVRVEIIRYTLGQLKKRNLGWLVYLLHHSLIADAHRPEFGPVGWPENLAFIEADGSLRPGHDIFNEF